MKYYVVCPLHYFLCTRCGLESIKSEHELSEDQKKVLKGYEKNFGPLGIEEKDLKKYA